MLKTFLMMLKCASTNQSRYITSHDFSIYREQYSQYMKMHIKGKNNPMVGKVFMYNLDKEISKRVQKSEVDSMIKDGWVLGRIINFKSFKQKLVKKEQAKLKREQAKLNRMSRQESIKEFQAWAKDHNLPIYKKQKCMPTKEKQLQILNKQAQYIEYYNLYNAYGFDKFVKLTGYKYSKQNLINNCIRYVADFVPQNGKKRGTK